MKLTYGVKDKPKFGQLIVFALQQLLAILAATIAVPSIVGNDMCIGMAAEAGQLELNAFEPVIFYKLFESIRMLTGAVQTFVDNCVAGITANEAHCEDLVNHSIGIITALCPYIGYTAAADIAKSAMRKNISVREELVERKIMKPEDIEKYMDPYAMT